MSHEGWDPNREAGVVASLIHVVGRTRAFVQELDASAREIRWWTGPAMSTPDSELNALIAVIELAAATLRDLDEIGTMLLRALHGVKARK